MASKAEEDFPMEAEEPSFPDLLSSDGKKYQIRLHNFHQQICNFMEKHKDSLSLPDDLDRSMKDTRSKPEINDLIEQQVNHVRRFISMFWDGVQSRIAQTDISPGNTSFSEAPAEGVFSVIERVMEGRSCLELNVVEAITRVVLEGPAVATTEGYNLSKEALSKWNDGKGEHFTTEKWMKGMQSKGIAECQAGTRQKTSKDTV